MADEPETAPAQPDSEPAAPETPTPATDDDPDLIELRNARTAATAEGADAQGEANADGQPVQPGSDTQPAGEDTPPARQNQDDPTVEASASEPGNETVMIPKPRFDEALERASKAELEAARLQGRLEAMSGLVQQSAGGQAHPGQPQPQSDPRQERIGAIDGEIEALATRFDNGEITYAETLKQQRALESEARTLRQEIEQAKARPAAEAAAPQTSDLYLDQLTAKIEREHPLLKHLNDAQFDFLAGQAGEELGGEGIALRGSEGSFILRTRIAELSDVYGPAMLTRAGWSAERIAAAQGVSQPKQPAQPRPPSSAEARREKLIQQGAMPPDIDRLNGSGSEVEPSDTDILAMTDEEIAALPAAVRQKALGINSP